MNDPTAGQFAGYRIAAQLGVGTATVYKAYRAETGQHVALKILPPHLSVNTDFVERFAREIPVIAGLVHSNILPVDDFGEWGGRHFLTTRWVEGGSLANLLKTDRQLEPADLCRIISQAGSALDFTHEKGVLHQDLRPENILFDSSGNCLVTGFGIIGIIEGTSRLPHFRNFLASHALVLPEQRSGKTVDHRSDIYSLGVVLYRMILGEGPCRTVTSAGGPLKPMHDPLSLPRERIIDLSEPVERVMVKALAGDPDDRYSTAGELADALENAVNTAGKTVTTAGEPADRIGPEAITWDTFAGTAERPPEPSAEPSPGMVKARKEGEKTPADKKEKARTGYGMTFAVLGLAFLALVAGTIWFYEHQRFSTGFTLEITTKPPGADLFVDGKLMGISPMVIKKLTFGSHRIRISKDRHEEFIKDVVNQKGSPEVILADLVPKPFGDLKIGSHPPGAAVFVDEEKKGVTPVFLENLPEGNRKVLLQKEGYEPWNGFARIIPLKQTDLSTDLVASFGALDIASKPSRGAVYVDGRKSGNTPLVLEMVKKGKRAIEIKKTGFAAWRSEVVVKPGERSKVQAVLGHLYGGLNIVTTPSGAMVYIDTAAVGKTPLVMGSIKKGQRKIAIRMADFETWRGVVNISPAEVAEINVVLSAIHGGLKGISTDGRFKQYANGVVYDRKSSLEWLPGPNRDTTWHQAKEWVDGLKVAGGGWRLPTRKELGTLYVKGAGLRNISPLITSGGWSVWSGEIRDASSVWGFSFTSGNPYWSFRNDIYGKSRGFAVR